MPSLLRSSLSPVVGWLLLACTSSTGASSTPDAVTLIAVDPADFPKKVAAAVGGQAGVAGQPSFDAAGAVVPAGDSGDPSVDCGVSNGSAYVAELIDVSGELEREAGVDQGIEQFPVQSSPPTSCGRTVAFGRVVPNREYEAIVNVYGDRDGDPSTIDLATIEGTSVAVDLDDGKRATPLRTLRCYGWQAARSVPSDSGAGGSGNAGTSAAGANAAGATVADSNTLGRPGLAIQYRTMTLHYCVEGGKPLDE